MEGKNILYKAFLLFYYIKYNIDNKIEFKQLILRENYTWLP